ncbi:MAG: beta-lactamase family protein [Actinobacteria bacterium]|nr:beta-lactamase family protein [Actinomycetota bacterium]
MLATGGWDCPAVSVAVAAPGATVATVGDQHRPYRLASVTKLLTAYACLVAVEEGTLELDEPAGPPGATVRHLLAHASGLGLDAGASAPPGHRRIYSNTGFQVLADLLGSRSAMPAHRYVADAVLEPLGMASTDVADRSLAHGATSTTGDLTRFAHELLRPSLVHPDTLREATTVQFPGLRGVLPGVGPQAPNDWGLGFELRDAKHPHWTGATNAPETFGHFGAAGTFLWVDPTVARALVVLTERAFGPWALQAWPPLSDAVVAAARAQ